MELRHRGGEKNSVEKDGIISQHKETIEDKTEVKGSNPTSSNTVGSPLVNVYSFVYDLLSLAFNYLYETFSAYLLYYEPQLDSSTKDRMESFRLEIKIPYNSENSEHEEKLLLLWKLSFPNEELLERKTKQWGQLGFQGKDPATDFRAGGVFALENLLYLAETYPVLFQLLLRGENHKEKFPLAISGFNLTMMLFEMIGWGMKTTLPETTQAKKAKHTLIRILFANDVTDTQIRFNELYCVVFDLFDQEWLALQANTLDFNQVKAGTKKKFENLAANSSSLQQIKQNSRCN